MDRMRPLYSACNEDTRSEIVALEPTSSDTVVAIAAGGGRVLSLLSQPCRTVVAIDRRLDQLYQLELKAAAAEAFGYDDFIAFVGLVDAPSRRDAYAAVRPALSAGARSYWDQRASLIKEGVLYAGRCERALAALGQTMRRLHLLDWAGACFAAPDLEDQRRVLETNRARLRRQEWFWRVGVQRLLVYAAIQDPGFLRSTEGSVGRYLYRRFLAYARNHQLRESFILSLIYHGRYAFADAAPLYLTRPAYDQMRKNLPRLSMTAASIEEVAARTCPTTPVKWSLSDVSAWMSASRFADLLRRIARNGVPGSRLCFRNFAARRCIPRDPALHLRRLDALCDRLDRDDSSVFWRFEVAEVYQPSLV